MSRTINVAPVRKSVTVKASQSRAFHFFTSNMDEWWPKLTSEGRPQFLEVRLEPKLDGKWLMRSPDGSVMEVGRVLAWEPDSRMVISWEYGMDGVAERAKASEIEVRFVPETVGITRVEIEHRKFERLGAAEAVATREGVTLGWPRMLEAFRASLGIRAE